MSSEIAIKLPRSALKRLRVNRNLFRRYLFLFSSFLPTGEKLVARDRHLCARKKEEGRKVVAARWRRLRQRRRNGENDTGADGPTASLNVAGKHIAANRNRCVPITPRSMIAPDFYVRFSVTRASERAREADLEIKIFLNICEDLQSRDRRASRTRTAHFYTVCLCPPLFPLCITPRVRNVRAYKSR